MKGIRHGAVIDVQIGISVQHEEFLLEKRQGAAKRAAGAQEARPVVMEAELDPRCASIAEGALELVAVMAVQHEDPPQAVFLEQLDDVPQERLAVDRNEGLGHLRRERAEPGSAASGEDHDLHHRA